MALLLKNGDIFLHVPKTGGTWVTEVLKEQDLVERPVGKKHADIARLGFEPEGKIFCVLRHPLSWYESWFRYQTNLGWQDFNGGWHPCRPLNGLGADTFTGFIVNVLENVPGFLSEMYANYTALADYICYQENLEEWLIRYFIERPFPDIVIDQSAILTHEVVHASPDALVELGSELKQMLMIAEREAVYRYGYQGRPGR